MIQQLTTNPSTANLPSPYHMAVLLRTKTILLLCLLHPGGHPPSRFARMDLLRIVCAHLLVRPSISPETREPATKGTGHRGC